VGAEWCSGFGHLTPPALEVKETAAQANVLPDMSASLASLRPLHIYINRWPPLLLILFSSRSQAFYLPREVYVSCTTSTIRRRSSKNGVLVWSTTVRIPAPAVMFTGHWQNTAQVRVCGDHSCLPDKIVQERGVWLTVNAGTHVLAGRLEEIVQERGLQRSFGALEDCPSTRSKVVKPTVH
jgi:hypothetical protein